MRKLGLKDAFSLARIIKAAGIRKEITDFAEIVRGDAKKQDLEAIGLEFFIVLIESVSDESTERKIYELYADIKGVTPEEVSMLGFAEIKADIAELMEVNDLKSFFSSLSALMSKQ